MITFVVNKQADKTRLDALMREQASLSQKKARRLCAMGAFAVNGVRCQATTRVREGAKVTFADEYTDLMLQLDLPVAFADDDVIVLHKPPGLAVHAGPLVDISVADILKRELPGSGLAQRLDREASGLLLIGRHSLALRALGIAMESGKIARTYEGIAHGSLGEEQRTIDLPLLVTDEPRGDQPKTIVDDAGQHSVSHVTVRNRRDGATHVSVALETGRTHQIRAHLSAIGHALLGDPRYGDREANQHARTTYGVHRTLLHCQQLSFPQPTTGDPVTVTAVGEPDFARMFPPRDR